MFGLDEHIASFSDGTTIAVVVLVAVALGLRHASDPDHLTALTTLVVSGRDDAARFAARLGLVWGLGHATSLFVFGLPIVLYRAYLPESAQRAAETAVGLMIVVLAFRLLMRSRRPAARPARGPAQAYAIGVMHGVAGTGGVGILLLAAIPGRGLAVTALGLFAVCTALSMAMLSGGVGFALGHPRVVRALSGLVPAIAVASLAFGVCYALAAQNVF